MSDTTCSLVWNRLHSLQPLEQSAGSRRACVEVVVCKVCPQTLTHLTLPRLILLNGAVQVHSPHASHTARGVALSDGDIRKTTENVRQLSDDVKAQSGRESSRWRFP
jgi:hypothetical protein